MPCDVVLNGITGSAGLRPDPGRAGRRPDPRAGQQGVAGHRRRRWSPGPPRPARSSRSTPSTPPWPSACAAARAAEVDRLVLTASGGPVPRPDPGRDGRRHPGAGAGPPDLGHGPGDHHQLGDPGQQGPRAARGAPALRRRPRPDRRRRPPAVDGALDGAVRRRLDPGPVLPAGHAAADRPGPELARPAAGRGRRLRLDAGQPAGPSSRWTTTPSRPSSWPGAPAGSAAPRRRSSTPPTRSASTRSTRAGSASCDILDIVERRAGRARRPGPRRPALFRTDRRRLVAGRASADLDARARCWPPTAGPGSGPRSWASVTVAAARRSKSATRWTS